MKTVGNEPSDWAAANAMSRGVRTTSPSSPSELPGDESDRILTDPSSVLGAFLSRNSHKHPELMDLRYVTELRIGLVIERDRRIFLGAAGNSLLAMSREEISTALVQTMRNCGVLEAVERWYDTLWLWWASGGRDDLADERASFADAERASLPPSGVSDA